MPSSITYPTADNTGSYTVSWGQSVGSATYVLQERVGAGAWQTVPGVVGLSKGFAKTPGTYQYQVMACAETLLFTGCSDYRTGHVLTVSAPPPPTGPAAPTITNIQTEKAFTWVLIHGDVPFLIPAFANARDGSASVTWGAVAGATRYEVRLRVNGQWLSWTSVGSDTFYNFYNEDYVSLEFEVRACDASGCGVATTRTVTLSGWRDLGTCNPNTGEQQQVCIGAGCTLHSTRYVLRCSQNITCNVP